MASVDIYFDDDRYRTMREQLEKEIFPDLWRLLAFAASLGWKLNRRVDQTGKNGKSVKIHADDVRGDALLVDMFGVLSAARSVPEGETLTSQDAIKALKSDDFSSRCKDLVAYAHGGLEYIEAAKEQDGDGKSYAEIVMDILVNGPDLDIFQPMKKMLMPSVDT